MLRKLFFQSFVLFLAVGCASKKLYHKNMALMSATTSEVPINIDSLGSNRQKIDGLSSVPFQFDSSALPINQRKILAKNRRNNFVPIK